MVLALRLSTLFHKLIAVIFLPHCYPVSRCSLCEFLQRCSQEHAKQPVFSKKYHNKITACMMRQMLAKRFNALTSCLPRLCRSKAASMTCLTAGGELDRSSFAPCIAISCKIVKPAMTDLSYYKAPNHNFLANVRLNK